MTYQTNVVGTFNVHHRRLSPGHRRVVLASSDAVIGWSYSDNFAGFLPLDENHPLGPENPFGLWKEMGETIARSYALGGFKL